MEKTLNALNKIVGEALAANKAYEALKGCYLKALTELNDAEHALHALTDELDDLDPNHPWSKYARLTSRVETEVRRLERKQSNLEYDIRRLRNKACWSRDDDERSYFERKERDAEDELRSAGRQIEQLKDMLANEKRKLGKDALDMEAQLTKARRAVEQAKAKYDSFYSQVVARRQSLEAYMRDARILANRLFAMDPSIKQIRLNSEKGCFVVEYKQPDLETE